MKRSEINASIRQAMDCFQRNNWHLPPQPRWDVTDFGLGDFERNGLTLINLADEPEYCEKLMYARRNQVTPAHCHARKKEDIIVRNGILVVQVWNGNPADAAAPFEIQVNNQKREVTHGERIRLHSGERVTLTPGMYHEFYPESDECIIGEVSTANNEQHDNFFVNPNVGRYSVIEEDEPALVRLLNE